VARPCRRFFSGNIPIPRVPARKPLRKGDESTTDRIRDHPDSADKWGAGSRTVRGSASALCVGFIRFEVTCLTGALDIGVALFHPRKYHDGTVPPISSRNVHFLASWYECNLVLDTSAKLSRSFRFLCPRGSVSCTRRTRLMTRKQSKDMHVPKVLPLLGGSMVRLSSQKG
jgi:hypothetical protein